jgi:hypothetical protein
VARWLPKLRQLRSLGYLVVTFPLRIRGSLRTKLDLRDMAHAVTKAIRGCGFSRGLRRWHWFGDESTTYNPHLNYLLDSGRLPKHQLSSLKRAINDAVGTECVIHYQYTTVPAKMMHLIRYVTRATFRDLSWDYELGDILYNLRNCASFGKWNDPPVWELKPTENDVSPQGVQVLSGICPHCRGAIVWSSHVKRLPADVPEQWENAGGRVFLLPHVPTREEWLTMPESVRQSARMFV